MKFNEKVQSLLTEDVRSSHAQAMVQDYIDRSLTTALPEEKSDLRKFLQKIKEDEDESKATWTFTSKYKTREEDVNYDKDDPTSFFTHLTFVVSIDCPEMKL